LTSTCCRVHGLYLGEGALTMGSQYGNAGTDLEPFCSGTDFVRKAEDARVKMRSPISPMTAISV
jgi:hypothetical protein